jgi:hypothetical protein
MTGLPPNITGSAVLIEADQAAVAEMIAAQEVAR